VSPSPVTVVMPTRDRWLLATLAIESVLAQEGVDLELIVVDDGSAGEAFGSVEDPRLRVLRSERSHGVARARDRGLQAAAHPWVAFLDDDDLWSPRHLGLTLEAAAEDRGAEWAYAAQIVIDEHSRPRYVRRAPSAEGMYAQLVRRNTIGTPSCVVARADLVRSVGSFDAAFSVFADWDLFFRLVERSRPARSAEATCAYRSHPGNMHLRMEETLAELEQLRARHGKVGRGNFSRWMADGFRARGSRRIAAAWYLRSARERRRPADVLRAAGVLLGERAMNVAARPPAAVATPDWLAAAQRRQVELAARGPT
jgi:glycosyltransferase involved in cell wall biosynthesis